jgi:hypothetical protein
MKFLAAAGALIVVLLTIGISSAPRGVILMNRIAPSGLKQQHACTPILRNERRYRARRESTQLPRFQWMRCCRKFSGTIRK